MSNKRTCDFCGEEIEEAPLVHDLLKCEHTELIKGRKEIKKLRDAINFWKDGWYECREIIGKMWWYHPAIDNDEKRSYYQEVLAGFRSRK